MTTVRAKEPADVSAPPIARETRQTRPVLAWAAIGGGFLALQLYIYTAWIASGPTRTPNGPSPIPGWMKITTPTLQIIGCLSAAVFVYYFLVKPWRRAGHITLDGLLTLGYMTLFWQDPLQNYMNTHFTYNTYFFNYGSWVNFIPGWISPRNELIPEPLLFGLPLYASVLLGGVVLANLIMRKAKERRPDLGVFGLVMVCLAFMVMLDVVMEPLLMVVGAWEYPSAIPWMTVFHGKYYQFPVYEAVLWGGVWTALACLRYFKNDRGQTIVERGVERVPCSTRSKTFLRFLAISGALNAIVLIGYAPPMWIMSMHAGEWPQDIQKRSYFTDGICGPGTDYACPGKTIPVPRPHSSHVSPDGELVPARHR